jgi:hydrogenase expression/formation protein HypC
MCYAIPAKILDIDGDNATVDYGGVTKRVNVSLVDGPAAGEFVLIHAGFAIEKLERGSAEKALEEIRNFVHESEKAGSRNQKVKR